eukprot:TRINITY_DN7654_c0_g1_i19.p2 TRINITY_DN7654_c0_g1~~TRINITY_DN7654_c0_g1_i19.p2  ORF type:complete len:150 (+),score=29.93 TRINITY_DN7654_c0_g1_i19:332-781(+)
MLSKPDIIKVRPQSKRKEYNPVFAVRTISNEVQDDLEENPDFKVTCNKIMKKMSMKNIALKRSQESTQLVNSTVYTRETSVSNKENVRLNANKPMGTRNDAGEKLGKHSKWLECVVESENGGNKIDNAAIVAIMQRYSSKVCSSLQGRT